MKVEFTELVLPPSLREFAERRITNLRDFEIPQMRRQLKLGMKNREEIIPRYEAELADLEAFMRNFEVKR